MDNTKPEIIGYIDYRKFLKDVFNYFKEISPKYSHRYIAKEVEASSAGWFSDIVRGRINCTSKFIPKLARVCKLDDIQAEYFELLVNYNQAGSIEEGQNLFKKMLSFSKPKSTLILADKFAFYNKWYIPAIRELLSIYDFSDDYKALSQKLYPLFQ